jgi:hypothetical protein
MAEFLPAIKEQARRLAFFKCCYCHERQGDHVHHLQPQEDGGDGSLDNAVLLCVLCHDRYGHRSDKRQQLRQARDQWYEIVADRYGAPDVAKLESTIGKMAGDISDIKHTLRSLTEQVIGNYERGSTGTSDIENVASSMVSSIVAPSPFRSNRTRRISYDVISGQLTDTTDGETD